MYSNFLQMLRISFMKMNGNLILNNIESKEYEIITYSARTLLWGKFVKGAEASCYLRWRQLTQRRPGNVSETIPDSTTRDDELRLHRPNRQRNVHHKCTGSPIFRTRRSRYSSWSQWWQRLLAVLAVFLWVGLCHGHIAQDINICQERYSGPADRSEYYCSLTVTIQCACARALCT